ncbi:MULTISPECIES: hypothetical protein [Streptomyces]|uniref:Integral membrane protein n=2 Tax=Streptomyces TaxID=1883 RepID=A0ABV3B698_9ACTN|nr:hypothetical protein [Streptomyces heilongjiangensis]MDC2951862.1 hypothetical protein [Streptomyces heilongjiangensis]
MINDSSTQTATAGRTGEQPSAQAAARIWTTPVDQVEVPTGDAQAIIKVTKDKFEAGMRVPGSHTGQMINASTRVLGLVGSVVGPLALLKLAVDLPMPWQGIWSLAVVLGLLPIGHVLLGNHHDKR